jgi:ABC-type uncharacterized transport system ATPase component
MKLQASCVAVSGTHAPLLLATSVTARTGEVTLVAGDPGHGQVALALGGRLVPSSGDIRLEGVADAKVLRSRVALVDVPNVTEPEEGLAVRAVIGEELALSRQRAEGGRRCIAVCTCMRTRTPTLGSRACRQRSSSRMPGRP